MKEEGQKIKRSGRGEKDVREMRENNYGMMRKRWVRIKNEKEVVAKNERKRREI